MRNRIKNVGYMQCEISIVEHCNLNCAHCNHFSPLVDHEIFLDLEEYRKQAMRLGELFPDKMKMFSLIGGEPLLHPQINEFIKAARAAFPDPEKTELQIWTNGLCFKSMPEEFWQTVRENKVIIELSEYNTPKIPYEEFHKILSEKGVDWAVPKEKTDPMFHIYVNCEEEQDDMENFCDRCYYSDRCLVCKDGRLFTCPVAAALPHYDRAFGTHLANDEAYGMDIYTHSAEELLRFVNTPIRQCMKCDLTPKVYFDWEKSTKKQEEW